MLFLDYIFVFFLWWGILIENFINLKMVLDVMLILNLSIICYDIYV